MSPLYTRLRVRRVMLQPEIVKEPEPEPPRKFGYVLMAVMGFILSRKQIKYTVKYVIYLVCIKSKNKV